MSYAYIIELPDNTLIKGGDRVEDRFGNSSVVAEYKAFESLLLRLIEEDHTKSEIIVNTDCQLIYRQFNFGAKPRNGFYLQTAFEVARLYKRFTNLKINWISRDENNEAHNLAEEYLKRA
jgi:ribonuclease HI